MTRFPRPQNLNDCFYAAAQHMRQKPVALTHKQTVRNTTRVCAATHTKSFVGDQNRCWFRVDPSTRDFIRLMLSF